ncbi:MAG: hypothetical protein CMP39_04325 [Rickettsiales bacterium]|nr:hypothetical protein [Rickettsiales bacterium]|tara:strand:+ start:194 stop:634 length:441 start_codon:yes stop_codon:yes gene_type:complete
MTTVAQVENGVLAHFATEWGSRTDLNWSAQNAPFETTKPRSGFTDNETFCAPILQQVSASSAEFPISESNKRLVYQLNLNLVTKPQKGVTTIQGHLAAIRNIFELKSLAVGNAVLQFEVLQTSAGFNSPTGDAFEVPCSIFFETTI